MEGKKWSKVLGVLSMHMTKVTFRTLFHRVSPRVNVRVVLKKITSSCRDFGIFLVNATKVWLKILSSKDDAKWLNTHLTMIVLIHRRI